MKTTYKFLLFILVLAAAFWFSDYHRKSLQSMDSSNIILKTMPDFRLAHFFSDKVFDRETLQGSAQKAFVFHFWATWCAPCEEEFPTLINMINHYADRKDISFYLVAVNDDQIKIRKFLDKYYPRIPANVFIVTNMDQNLLTQFGTVKIPETYVFNKDLYTKFKFIGPQNWANTTFINKIDEVLSE